MSDTVILAIISSITTLVSGWIALQQARNRAAIKTNTDLTRRTNELVNGDRARLQSEVERLTALLRSKE